jgi:hypothetical protein
VNQLVFERVDFFLQLFLDQFCHGLPLGLWDYNPAVLGYDGDMSYYSRRDMTDAFLRPTLTG